MRAKKAKRLRARARKSSMGMPHLAYEPTKYRRSYMEGEGEKRKTVHVIRTTIRLTKGCGRWNYLRLKEAT